MPQGEVEVVEIILLPGGGDPADFDVREVLMIVEKCVKSIKRIVGIGVQVFQTGHEVDAVRQPSASPKAQCGIVRQIHGRRPDTEYKVIKVRPGAGESIDIDPVRNVEKSGSKSEANDGNINKKCLKSFVAKCLS